jgi:hypothetical protein
MFYSASLVFGSEIELLGHGLSRSKKIRVAGAKYVGFPGRKWADLQVSLGKNQTTAHARGETARASRFK